MLQRKKSSLVQNVERADVAKKVNPLDLSSDQDLTIALINLVAIEDMAPSGQITQMVRGIREKLMSKMVADDDKHSCAHEFLSNAALKMKEGDDAQKSGDDKLAREMYDAAYDAYVMFLATIYGVTE